jgi:prefoldin subunit 5
MRGHESGPEDLRATLLALRQEIVELRAEQRELARAVEEMVRTFRVLATHLGIATEPYKKTGAEAARSRDFSGFA